MCMHNLWLITVKQYSQLVIYLLIIRITVYNSFPYGIVTFRSITFGDRTLGKTIFEATAPSLATRFTATFDEFNYCLWRRESKTPDWNILTIHRIPPISFYWRKLKAKSLVGLIWHCDIVHTEDMGQQCCTSWRQHLSLFLARNSSHLSDGKVDGPLELQTCSSV